MYALLIACLLGTVGVVGADPAPAVQESPPPSRAAGTAGPIAVKRTEPVRVAFLEHVGPYWKVGARLRQVREHMLRRGPTAPIFTRYIEDPYHAAPTSQRAEIGFFIDEKQEPGPPFKTARRDGELVAYMVIEGRVARPRTDYARIHDWIQVHGHEALGPITEVYQPTARGSRPDRHRTEVRVTLREPQTPSRQTDERSPAVQSGDADSGSSTPLTECGEQLGRTQGAGDPIARDIATPVVQRGLDSQPSALQQSASQRSESEPSASQADVATSEPRPATVEPKREPDAVEPHLRVSDLVEAGDFDRIAGQLMPEDQPIADSLQIWFGQVVFRVGAVAKGIEQVHPGQDHDASAIAETISRHYKQVSAGFTFDPLDQVVVRVDVGSDMHGAQKRRIMRDLDTLMGRIAFRSVDAQAATQELIRILQSLQDLLQECGEDGAVGGVP